MKLKPQKGFTLIEILVTLLIFALLSMLATTSLFSLLRGGAKTEVLKEIKQNGDYALGILETRLRNAVGVSSCDGISYSSLIVTNPDATTSTFSCDTTFKRLQETLSSDPFNPRYLTNTSVQLPNTASCFTANVRFTCTDPGSGQSKHVEISFTLADPNDLTNLQTFTSQITLRNK